MQEKARVVEIDGEVASVVALDLDVCIGCSNADCKKNGSVFRAVNARHLPLSVGDEVRISAAAKNQAKQGLFAIGVPFAFAILGYVAITLAVPSAGDGLRTGVALLTLVVGSLLSFGLRKFFAQALPEIVEVL